MFTSAAEAWKAGDIEVRTIFIAMAAVAAAGMVSVSDAPAVPVNGVVIDHVADVALLTGQVHCRWYPHRHRHNRPHGWGRGCAGSHPPKK
jgi:hypothetical protein